MTLASTVDVVWRPGRDRWVVEGGNGRAAVLGVHSLHESREDAVAAAAELGDAFDADVRVLNEPGDDWPRFEAHDVDASHLGQNPGGPDVR